MANIAAVPEILMKINKKRLKRVKKRGGADTWFVAQLTGLAGGYTAPPTDEAVMAEVLVDLQEHGISTSGSYRHYYELNGKRISHIIKPVPGWPIGHKLVSATVIAITALEADGWDTGLILLGTEKAQKLVMREGLAVLLITESDHGFTTWMSPKFSSFIISRNDTDA